MMKLGFDKFNHLLTSTTLIAAILKTMIFIDNNNTTRKIAIYLQD